MDNEQITHINNDTTNMPVSIEIRSDLHEVDNNETVDIHLKCEKFKTPPSLFHGIFHGDVALQFPDLSWGMHRCEEPIKYVTIAQMSKIADHNKVTSYSKQIVLSENLILKLFVLNKEVLQKKVQNLPELISALQEMFNLNVCMGGPSITFYKNIHPRCAFRDLSSNCWRHNLCSLVADESTTCVKCSSLDKILRQHLDRKAQSKKIHIVIAPSRKKKIEVMRRAHRIQMQAYRRNKRRIEGMKSEFRELQKKYTSVSQRSLKDSIQDLNLPRAQISLIEECVSVGKHASINGRRYTNEWLLTCLLLQIRSPATYNFLRENNILPLPCRTTIRKYLNMINLKCGFDEKFFKIFSKKLHTLPETARHGLLIFDEMQVRKSVSVNAKDLTLIGLVDDGSETNNNSTSDLADHALVFMFSSVSLNFYQPIATFASKSATAGKILAQLVIQAVVEVEKAGGFIDAIICDGAATNRKMWSELGISGNIDQPSDYFLNPYDIDRKVYVLSDSPHLIKCVRNRLHKEKTLKINGSTVDWKYYKYLYDQDFLNPTNLRVCPKLSMYHINPTNCLKMRVFLATQIFSNSVAAGIRFYRHKKIKRFEESEGTEEFTLRMNNLVDVFNRSFPAEGISEGSKDFKTLEDSLNWLNCWERELRDGKIEPLQFLTKTTAEGLRVTIMSTIALTKYLLNDCQFRYVLTAKPNQDRLEQFFGIIRQAGCQNDHPTIPTFLQLYKMLSIYKILKPPKFGNCIVTEEEPTSKISLQDIKSIFQSDNNNQSYRSSHIEQLKARLNNLIDSGDFECDDVIPTDHDYDTAAINDCIIYYVTGFVCRKLWKMSTCDVCKHIFKNEQTGPYCSAKEADLVNIKTKGRLIHPNKVLFNLFQSVERIFERHINLGIPNLYQATVDDALINCTFTFPYELHKLDVLAYCLHYYTVMRMRQFTKIQSDVLKVSREKKKLAKLHST